MNLKIFKFTFFGIILAELLSFLGYFYPTFNKAGFLAIVLITLILSLYKLEYGVLILLSELFIGSKGYLFSFDFGGFSISIRIALWLIVMAVWAGKTIGGYIKNKKLEIEFLKSPYAKYFIILFVFIAWGVINGILRGNSFNNLFFDFNGWLYFLAVLPVYDAICGAWNVETPRLKVGTSLWNIFLVFTAAIIWLSIKTFFLLFIFSHSSMDAAYEIYRWVRTSGVGEITNIKGGFYRIFFQSHIFALIGFFIFLFLFIEEILKTTFSVINNFKNYYFPFLLSCFLLSAILISFSRSFWIGLAFGLILVFAYLIWQKISVDKILKIILNIILAMVLGFLLIIAIVKFPFPKPIEDFNTADLLSERVSNLNESAVASRWDLLPPLWQKIKKAPLLGEGFGATVSYKSSDPRVLEQNPSGKYITYAFEWGWLDIWLKLGPLGLIAYLALILKIIIDGLIKIFNFPLPSQAKRGGQFSIFNELKIITGLIIGIAVVSVVNIFSPYLNHPLGIGYLILVSAILNKKRGVEINP
jgi:hypothetical protein